MSTSPQPRVAFDTATPSLSQDKAASTHLPGIAVEKKLIDLAIPAQRTASAVKHTVALAAQAASTSQPGSDSSVRHREIPQQGASKKNNSNKTVSP